MDPLYLTPEDMTELYDKVLSNLRIEIRPHYENWCKTIQYKDVIEIEVYDTQTLCELAKELNKLNQERIKAKKKKIILRAAAGCIQQNKDRFKNFSNLESDTQYQTSFSVSPCVQAHIILHLIGKEFDKIEVNGVMVTVGPNVQIGQLEATLYKNRPGLSLPVAPLIPWVTLVGLAANAGHGTGLNQPAITGLIESITMVKANGELKTINKTDDDFNTINGAHLGLFGLVTQVTIKCIPAYKLKATTYAWSLNEFFTQVKDKNLYENNEYVSVMYIPTYHKRKQEREFINVHVMVAKQVSIQTDDLNWSENEQLHEDKHQLSQMNVHNILSKLHIPDFLRDVSLLIPYAMRLIASTQVGVLNSSPSIKIGPSYQIAHYQRQFPRELDDIDFLFPVKQPKEMLKAVQMEAYQPDEYIAAIDIVTDPKSIYYQLSPKEREEGKPNKFKEDIQEYFMDPNNKFYAKPHWGKTLPFNTNYAELYGNDFKKFIHVAENWYKNVGCTFYTSPFMNPFFEQIFGIVTQPIREVKSMNMIRTIEHTFPINETKPVTDEEVKQLQEYMIERTARLDENFQFVAHHDLPYISLYSRAGDPNEYLIQQREIQNRAEQFFQELRKLVEQTAQKNIDDKTTLN
ncbi:unnamed protein product [Rotaria sordida]|uniref:FAD-binding PCMH-type domain-containing protein n=1 Tax=Rotaria sordida TaxID=392033 RepID=A0A815KTL2_9BILA|nr:unnamed protein product [Rotaria sordida]